MVVWCNSVTAVGTVITGVTVSSIISSLNNLLNWPSSANRPTLSGAGSSILTWIGPVGGGPSTSSDVLQTAVLTAYSGANPIVTNGTVVTNKTITGTLQINANNCRIAQCSFTGPGTYSIQTGDHQNGNVYEDCIFQGSTGSFSVRTGGSSSGNTTFCRRLNISSYEDGLGPISGGGGNVTVIDCWIHDLANVSGAHTDGTSFDDGGDAVTIQHNYVDLGGQTANTAGGISASNLFGAVTNYQVINNYVNGGTNTILLDGNQSTTNAGIVSAQITNNTLIYASTANICLHRGDTGTTATGNVGSSNPNGPLLSVDSAI